MLLLLAGQKNISIIRCHHNITTAVGDVADWRGEEKEKKGERKKEKKVSIFGWSFNGNVLKYSQKHAF